MHLTEMPLILSNRLGCEIKIFSKLFALWLLETHLEMKISCLKKPFSKWYKVRGHEMDSHTTCTI